MVGYIEKPRYQCALGGALSTINSLNRGVAIVHAAPGCATTVDSASATGSGYWGASYCGGRATPSSNITEKEIIFGGEARLREQIQNTLEIIDGDLFAVLTGCMTDIIGDDVKAVVDDFQKQGKPVIVAETGGFKGNSHKGYDFIWEAIIKQYIIKSPVKNPSLVNLFGLVPAQDVFWRGNLLEIKRLLEQLDLQVNSFLTPFDDLSSLQSAAQAGLNIVLSDVHGQQTARAFEEQHSVPYITAPLPIGPTATRKFLSDIARQLEIDIQKVNHLLEKEEKYYYSYVENLADIYNDLDLQRYGIVIGDSTYAYALTSFIINDLGWIPYFTAVTDELEDLAKDQISKRFADIDCYLRPYLLFATDTYEIGTRLKEYIVNENDPYSSPIQPAFVLGSTLDRSLASELRAGFYSVSYPVSNRVVTDQFYAGYRGGLHLLTEILSVLLSNR